MKIRLFLKNLSLLLIVHGTLLSYNIPEGYSFIEPELVPIIRETDEISHRKEVTSTNWSGYAAAAANLNQPTHEAVSAVYGTWIVPTVTASAHGASTYSAFWVGIDGYSSGTVEQIGTEHDWAKGNANYYVWFEIYPKNSHSVKNFPINPGDVMSASVEYVGDNIFMLYIANHTRQAYTTIPSSYTTLSGAQRSSAEWIVEAPSLPGRVLPLTNFGTAEFSSCSATINGITAPIQNDSWPHVALEMITNNGTPKAIPSGLVNNEAFSVTWAHK